MANTFDFEDSYFKNLKKFREDFDFSEKHDESFIPLGLNKRIDGVIKKSFYSKFIKEDLNIDVDETRFASLHFGKSLNKGIHFEFNQKTILSRTTIPPSSEYPWERSACLFYEEAFFYYHTHKGIFLREQFKNFSQLILDDDNFITRSDSHLSGLDNSLVRIEKS